MIFVIVLLIWIVSLCLHEYSHARVAYAGGDDSVVAKGYLTMNPLRYMNPMTSIVLPAIFLMMGWMALPGGAVWIDHSRLRSKKWESAVSLAGPASNLALCILLALPFTLGFGGTSTMWAILAVSCFWQGVAFILNMLPIPGLDGYGALEPWLPAEAREWGRRFAPYGFIILVVLFVSSPQFQGAFFGAVFHILGFLRVDSDAFRAGYAGMFPWRN